MRTVVVALVVLLLAAVGADRLAEKVATDRAETRLAAEGLRDPRVDVGGFPFLSQLLAGSYDDVRVTAVSVSSSSGRARDLTVTARSVSVPGQDRATVGSLRATGLVTYAEVLSRAGVRGVRLEPAGGDRVRLSGRVDLLGQSRPIAAVGRVRGTGRTVRVTPDEFELDGEAVSSSRLLAQLDRQYRLVYRLPDLPQGVEFTDVHPRADGFRVVLTGTDVSVSTGG